MEVLPENVETVEHIEPAWNEWLMFDNRPRIVERGIDFSADISTVKRHLFTEASRRGYDITAKVLHGDRLMFQVFHPGDDLPRLPEGSDARKKYPWSQWLDGEVHEVILETEGEKRSLRAYVYKQAKARGLKVRVVFTDNGLTIQSYKEQ